MKFRKKSFSKEKFAVRHCDPSEVSNEWNNELHNSKNIDNDGSDDGEENIPKWYEEFSDTPEKCKDLSTEEITILKEEARKVLNDESLFYCSKRDKKKKGNGADDSWIKTVIQKGTASDKVAAHILKIQDSPVYNLSSLVSLINMVKVSKKEFSFVIDALVELLIGDLLPANRKLRQFEGQPLDRLGELTSGNAMSRRKRLAYWMFEDELKKLYSQLIHSLNSITKDSVEANKEKGVSVLYKLLVSVPEQEDVILSILVNKLGDPNRKVVSKAIYSLTQLLRVHDAMKQVVMDEVERLLFRPNISVKAQYYAICFLSQFHFTINDDQVAVNIIKIYFSFFKACIKKGDVNSRMLGSLLMGLNRAYPYAKKNVNSLSDHMNTLYKLVHLANFNISLQCLSVLSQTADASEDRFYCALYKKLSDVNLGNSCHQAMFINLLYKALMKDNNIGRIRTFIKRILQLCCLMPVPLTCGLLYLVSQLINKRKTLSGNEIRTNPLTEKFGNGEGDESDGEEHYIDVDKLVKEEDANLDVKDKKLDSIGEITSELKVDVDVNYELNKTGNSFNSKNNNAKERKPCTSWYHTMFRRKKNGFEPLSRNPAFAQGELATYTELTQLTRHFHPTVALFATNILEDKVITYTGDPLVDFTLVRFIERFVFKNPKKIIPGVEAKGPDPVLAPRKYYTASGPKALPTNSRLYLDLKEENVPIDELFLFRYLQEKQKLGYNVAKKEKGEEDFSDVDSVASEEFEEMLDNMMSKKGAKLDFADDIGDNLSKKSKKKKKSEDDSDDDDVEDDDDDEDEDDVEAEDDYDEEGEEETVIDRSSKKMNKNGSFDGNDSDDGDDIDIDDGSDIDLDGIDDSDAEVMDFNTSDEDEMFDKSNKKKGSKFNIKKLRKGMSGIFAPAEEFSEMLEEAGSSGFKLGTSQTLANKDKAAAKQIEWEMKRNNWMSGKKRRKDKNFPTGKKRRF